MKQKDRMMKQVVIFLSFFTGIFLILNILFAGYPLVYMRGLIMEITKHDHIVKREMDIYLFEKYHESFEIESLNSRFLDPNYFSTVVLSKYPKAKFTVIGTPIAQSNKHYRFVDNYMQIKWQEEANHELAPILRKGISPNMYLEVEIPDQIDFDEYKNTTLSLKKFQEKYPDISIVNIRLIYGTQFKQEDNISSELNNLILKTKKTSIHSATISLSVLDARTFKDIKTFKSNVKEIGISNFLDKYSSKIIEKQFLDIKNK